MMSMAVLNVAVPSRYVAVVFEYPPPPALVVRVREVPLNVNAFELPVVMHVM
jgi:hypothetical protein